MIPDFIINPDPSVYLRDNYWVVDFENTITDGNGGAVLPENRLLYSYMINHKNEKVEVEGGELELSRVLDRFYEVDFVVAHNAKHEIQWLKRAGLDTERVLFYDTQIGEYVLAGNRKRPLSLDKTAQRYGYKAKDKYVDILMKNGVCPSTYPKSLLYERCKQDVRSTKHVFLQQREELKKRGLLPVFFTRCIFTPVVADMEMNGMHLDKEMVEHIHKEKVEEYDKICKELQKITGGINMASPQQVADFIYNTLKFAIPRTRKNRPLVGKPSKMFPNGTPKTNEDAIKLLKPRTERQRRFIELKQKESKLRKAVTSYMRLFKDACDNHGCMIYGKINQTVTATHRLSSSRPNLQNIDRTFKKVFNARNPNYNIREADYDQLEFRAAGFLSQDPTLLADVLRDDFDAHAQSATTIFGQAFTSTAKDSPRYKELRTRAKPHTFKPLYGGQSGTSAERKYYKAFLERYKGVGAWHEELLSEAASTGKQVTASGLIFYFPYAGYNSEGYFEGQTTIKNYPVQSFATAEIATIGATMTWHHMKDLKLKSFIINEVHDSVIIEEHKDENLGNFLEIWMSKDVLRYLKQVYEVDYNYPLTIETEITTHWGT